MRRITTQTLRLTGAPVASATVNFWAAPAPCTVVAVRALRTAGASAVVNVKAGGTNVLPANLTAGNDTFAKAPALDAAAADMAVDEMLAVQVVSGDATAVTVQVDILLDADADQQ